MKYKVSVIVAAYNVDQWIGNCITSISNQTYSNLEIIVIDDGSTDRTGAIIDEHAAIDSRIIAIHQANAGLVGVREKGISVSSGDYVTFVDGDDMIASDMYERLVNNAVKYDADISHCGMIFVWPSGIKEWHYGTNRIRIQDNYSGICDLLEGNIVEPSLCNKLYSRRIIANSCPDKSITNNEDLLRNYVLFSRASKSVFDDFCGYLYLQRRGSISKDSKRLVSAFRDIEKARRYIVDNSPENIYPYAMRLWLSTYINQINVSIDSKDEQMITLAKECRGVIKQNRNNIRYLVKRQQLAAYLILGMSFVYRVAYKLYSKGR